MKKEKQMTEVKISKLLKLMALYGGKIVSTASLDPEEIRQAMASGRMYVNKQGLGFVWEPPLLRMPRTEKEVKYFEKWWPLDVELPPALQNTDWLFKGKES